MTARPLTSIVIPCFNHARFLAEAIESALTQSPGPVEVLVVNDGSTDDTSAVAGRYPAVRVIEQTNQGLSKARNTGLAAAAGDYVIFLDADDRLLPGAVAAGVSLAESDPRIALVAGQCRIIAEDGAPRTIARPAPVDADPYETLLSRNFIWTPGAALCRRHHVVEAGGFDATVPASADYALYLRLARRHAVVYHATPVVEYRQHARSMSRDPALMLRTTLAVLESERPYVPLRLAPAWAAGRRAWRRFYGERMVQDLRRDWRGDPRPSLMVRRGLALARHYPRGAARHAARALLRAVRGSPRDEREEAALRSDPGSGGAGYPGR